MKLSVFELPGRDRVVRVSWAVSRQPGSGALVVFLPRELEGEQPAAGAEQSDDGRQNGRQVGVVERHERADRVEAPERALEGAPLVEV